MDENTPQSRDTNPTTTTHGVTTYLPLPKEEREGIALCLSGGGYRAALFHLGSLRRLNELGILAHVDTITSVSGGSIFTAHLAQYLIRKSGGWPLQNGVINDWEDGVARPMRAFARRNIRTLAALAQYDPRNWINGRGSIEALAERYAEGITREAFQALPVHPRFVFCATDMEFGSQWLFDSGLCRVGSKSAGFASPPPDEWTLARAVAASSSLPGAFAPLRATTDPGAYAAGDYEGADRAARIGRMVLTDGGMYDNLGLEPVWRDHRVVLVSDGGPTFASWKFPSLLWRGLRHAVILLDQATDLRKRWLISNFLKEELEGTYWSVQSQPKNYDYTPAGPVYSENLIENRISRVRIDLDAFTAAEIAVLENHGYITADIAIQRHVSHLIRQQRPVQVPHPEWMDERKVERALKRSDRVSLLGRGRPI